LPVVGYGDPCLGSLGDIHSRSAFFHITFCFFNISSLLF